MGYRDLRDYLRTLEDELQLIRVGDKILPEPDVRAVARAAIDMPDGPAVLLDNVKGYRGRKIALNVHGSWANHALMLGLPKNTSVKEQYFELNRRWSKYPGEIQHVKNAPCQEVVVRKNINLYELLPLFRINKFDGGFYLSKACVVTKDIQDPQNFDKENVGVYRLQVQGPDTIGIQALAFHDIGIHLRKAEEINEPLPVAICIGVHPVLLFMACAAIPYDQSEYKYSAALNGQPEALTKAVTADLDIPAYAEYVIEGYVIPRQRFPEGPFGEFPGSYSGVRNQSRIQVTAVTHRREPIFENLYIGRPWTEHDYLIGLSTSLSVARQIQDTMPEVVAVNATYQHGLSVIVALRSKFGGYAKSVAFRVAATNHGISYAKNIILVDADVDPFNLTEVMTALSTRVRPDKDVMVLANTPGMPLDPCSEPPGMGSKLVIDATTPVAPEPLMREVRMIDNVSEAARFRDMLAELRNITRLCSLITPPL